MQKIINKATLAEQAYEYIKEMILTGELQPGQELPEEKLAAELGISRTPLREALKRLAADALIDLRKTRPAIVAEFTHEDVKEIMELRRLLEIHSLGYMSTSDQRRVAHELKQILAAQWQAINEEDFISFMDKDQEFHNVLYQDIPNRRLKEMIHTINTGGSRAFLFLSDTIHDSATEAYHEHVAILKALEEENLEKAKVKMEIHLANIEKRLLKYIKQEEL